MYLHINFDMIYMNCFTHSQMSITRFCLVFLFSINNHILWFCLNFSVRLYNINMFKNGTAISKEKKTFKVIFL